MPHSARHALASLLIALHAVIAVGGSGLHVGLGAGHASATRSEGRDDPAEVAASPADHCPICDYCAQGQLQLQSGILTLARHESPFEPTLRRVQAPRPPPVCSQSRAPPCRVGLAEPTSLEAIPCAACRV